MKHRKSINKYSRDKDTMLRRGSQKPASKADMKLLTEALVFGSTFNAQKHLFTDFSLENDDARSDTHGSSDSV